MATRKPKQTDDHLIKALNPRDADTKYMGDEPFFALQPDTESRTIVLTRSFTWYNRFYGKKDAKELLCTFLDNRERTTEAKHLRKVHESEFLMTLCWLARMNMRGLELTEHENTTLENEIARLFKLVHKPEVIEKVEKENKPTIQDYLREKASEAAGELEGVFDIFVTEGAKSSHGLKPIDEVAKKNVSPQHISLLTEVWKKKEKHGRRRRHLNLEEEEERRKKRQIKKGASSCRTLGSIVILIFKKKNQV